MPTRGKARTTGAVRERPAAYGPPPGGEVVFYRSPDGSVQLDVKLDKETVWLSLNQIAELFGRDKSVISRHLGNVYGARELGREATVARIATAQDEGGRRVVRDIEYFSLDAILSVGYRVNSRRGTQFRIWATQVLKDHLLKGYSVNQRRLAELKQTVRLVTNVAERRELSGDEATGLLRVVGEYSRALDLLDDYDHQRVAVPGAGRKTLHALSYDETVRIVDRLRERFGGSTLFGQEKDDSLHSSLNAIMQTFDGRDLYPALEEKAAHLLYFIVKNHSFVDGNKRIAAALFLWFLQKNGALYGSDGKPRLSDAALVALTLLIAESDPAEKDTIVRLVTHLLAERPVERSP
jgi:prophage maintenance system killer protein